MESNSGPLVIGAGPAGLTAALALAQRGVTPRVYEAAGHVGGLARTTRDGAWLIDPGGHRFFTKSEEVLALWRSLLGPDEWISVQRRSAMLIDGHYVRYPLAGPDLLTQLGMLRGLRGLASFLRSRLRGGTGATGDSTNFRDWGTAEFGRYWYEVFFDCYVRKTWLVDPQDITSQWANQRIRPITWRRSDFRRQAADVFRYPRLGPGQLWEAAAATLVDMGVVPSMNSHVDEVRFTDGAWTVTLGNGTTASGDAVFSSMPLRVLVQCLQPAPPQHILATAAALKHRALITVAVAVEGRHHIPYNWVYTPGNDFRVGRIQNYGQWSSALSPADWEGTYLGLEYFTNPHDELWTASAHELEEVVARDLGTLGLTG
nr:FAD-dependent oxidoreductase [Actinomycetota bacterium]